MENLFNQIMTFFVLAGFLFLAAVIVWIKNNSNSFQEVLTKVQSLVLFNSEKQKQFDAMEKDLIVLRSNHLKMKLEFEQVQDHFMKVKDQMVILKNNQRYFKSELIPRKLIVEHVNPPVGLSGRGNKKDILNNKILSQQYASEFKKIKDKLKDL